MSRRQPIAVHSALGVVLAMLCLTAPAVGATPSIGATATADGSYSLVATVTWNSCPEVCDWKINLTEVDDPARCPQRALPDMPEGVSYSPSQGGLLGDGPYPANGTRAVFMVNVHPAPSRYSHLCIAAVGLTARAQGPSSPSQACPDPASGPYHNEPRALTYGRCLRLYPITTLALPADRPVLGRAGPALVAPVTLTFSKARRALRLRGIRGRTNLRRTGSGEVHAVVYTARGARRYRITSSPNGVRLRRE